MDNEHLKIGKIGEDLATEYLAERGYKILERNIREKFGEIDILAKDKKGTVHFVEVKTISSGYADWSGMEAEDNLSGAKLLKMKKIAGWYANLHSEMVPGAYQLDLVAIKIDPTKEEFELKLHSNLS